MWQRVVYCVKFWFFFLAIFLLACGHGGGASSALHLQLKIPANYTAASFWVGVKEKTLIVESSRGEIREKTPWSSQIKADLHLGDHLRFEGLDATGILLVFGEVEVGREDTLWLPVERVL